MPRLIVESPDFAGQAYELTDPKMTIGRVPDNIVHIPDPSISSHHGELRLEGGDYKIVDFNSTNGTRVNDERISESILRNNDIVMFGNVILRYESENVLSAPPMPDAMQNASIGAVGGRNSVRPANFSNLAPFAKPGAKKASLPMPLVLAVVAAFAAFGWYVTNLFVL
ncbi:MAG: FHA domain-containing protein [Verrucomicrobiota bacterium]